MSTRGYHVEGNILFFPIFFLEKVIIDAINVKKEEFKKQMAREHLLVIGGGGGGIEKSSGTSQFVFEELHL